MSQFWNEPLTRETLPEFFNQFAEAAYSYLFSVTGDEAQTEKMVEQAFINLYRQRRHLQPSQLVFSLGTELDRVCGAKEGEEPAFETRTPDVEAMARMLNHVQHEADSLVSGWTSSTVPIVPVTEETVAEKPEQKPEKPSDQPVQVPLAAEQHVPGSDGFKRSSSYHGSDKKKKTRLMMIIAVAAILVLAGGYAMAASGIIPVAKWLGQTSPAVEPTPTPTVIVQLITPTPSAVSTAEPTAIPEETPSPTPEETVTPTSSLTTAATNQGGSNTTKKTTKADGDNTTKKTTKADGDNTTKKTTKATDPTQTKSTTVTEPAENPTTKATEPTTTAAVSTPTPVRTPTPTPTPTPPKEPQYVEPDKLDESAKEAYDNLLNTDVQIVYDPVWGSYFLPGTSVTWDTELTDVDGNAQLTITDKDGRIFPVSYDAKAGTLYAMSGDSKRYLTPTGEVISVNGKPVTILSNLPEVPMWFYLTAVGGQDGVAADTLEYLNGVDGLTYVYNRTSKTWTEKAGGTVVNVTNMNSVPDDNGTAVVRAIRNSKGRIYWYNSYDKVNFLSDGEGGWVNAKNDKKYNLKLPSTN